MTLLREKEKKESEGKGGFSSLSPTSGSSTPGQGHRAAARPLEGGGAGYPEHLG